LAGCSQSYTFDSTHLSFLFGYNFRYSAEQSSAAGALVKTPSGRWKAIIRRAGWPLTVKTFRTQRDAGDWARRTEDEMVRGAYIQRASSDRMTVAAAMKRYLTDIVPTKRPTGQATDRRRSKILVKHLGRYSMASLTPEVIAQFRDMRLAGEDRKDDDGKPCPRTNNTVKSDSRLRFAVVSSECPSARNVAACLCLPLLLGPRSPDRRLRFGFSITVT